MSCLQTISIQSKNGRVNVPCGRCHACKAKRRHDWSFRLAEELKVAKTAYFITLTYDDINLVYGSSERATLCKRDVQLFLKRLRKEQIKIHKRDNHTSSYIKQHRIRYYACGEYGEKSQRPHYHIILFNLLEELKPFVVDVWALGHAHVGECNPKTIAYTTKYVLKSPMEKHGDIEREFSLMSRKPALGENYLKKNKKFHLENKTTTVRNDSGGLQRMPRYYKDKIFTKYQKEKISERDLKAASKAALKEESRIKRLGNEVGKYQLDQLSHRIAMQDKGISKSEIL